MGGKQSTQKNYTQMPNVIFDYWMAQLPSPQFEILLTIVRKTVGWQKLEDAISIGQFKKITGLSHSTIIKGIKELLSRGLITQRKLKSSEGDDAPSIYSINFEVLQQCEGTQKGIPRRQESLEGCLKDIPPVGSELENRDQNELPPVVETQTHSGSQNPLPTKESSHPQETFTEEIPPKPIAIKEIFSSSSSSLEIVASDSFDDWRKMKRSEGWAEGEIEEALRRLAAQPVGSIACPRAWLETTLQSVRDGGWQKAEVVKAQEMQKQEAECKAREQEEYQERRRKEAEKTEQERQMQMEKEESVSRRWIEDNKALAEHFQGKPWLEYASGKSYAKLIANGESYAGCIGFSDPDFRRLFLECMEKEASLEELTDARLLLESRKCVTRV
ncbi:MAG TPA: replication protein [Rhabdochlamydiaceae bacterium]|jgi:phage replication O-like protein O